LASLAACRSPFPSQARLPCRIAAVNALGSYAVGKPQLAQAVVPNRGAAELSSSGLNQSDRTRYQLRASLRSLAERIQQLISSSSPAPGLAVVSHHAASNKSEADFGCGRSANKTSRVDQERQPAPTRWRGSGVCERRCGAQPLLAGEWRGMQDLVQHSQLHRRQEHRFQIAAGR